MMREATFTVLAIVVGMCKYEIPFRQEMGPISSLILVMLRMDIIIIITILQVFILCIALMSHMTRN